ncbi:MAG TPA: TIGR00730 family Rossman fold protein [Phycisphaerales bacterium]|jgi:uncharacterized protein (TIGR00730 family)|nr:TIGR00730 family Rossman fold protein [Phycisphaerales bacterium]
MSSSSPRPLSPLCVYCGASSGARPEYAAAARALGSVMASRGIALIYGGGRAGMMGHIADAVLAGGGIVTGVITQYLMDKELGHKGIHDLKVVDTMHERKKLMADTARAFIALPGGVGTLDELFEIIAWAQLGIHDHPIGLLNVNGFYDPLEAMLRRMEQEKFLRVSPDDALVIDSDPARLLDRLSVHPPRAPRSHAGE